MRLIDRSGNHLIGKTAPVALNNELKKLVQANQKLEKAVTELLEVTTQL